ncbi:glycosyltransferase [uncultured Methanobrevibacter sp.]|uniref:glycosyltransferase family 2 protein n=1 Tax=uncultured Methanobrevibacter sp. TaxID=253161 RepID=UPI002606C6A9|nr:glycosyltransferase [uncultured Methanobrevibacter sp.]
MNENVEISVIIPIFNAEKYLDKCLDSIINQSFTNLEIICVNDGSTDGTLDILKEYSKKDARIKIINIENHGSGYARNIALDEVNGNYVSFIDADDWVDLNFYEILHEFIVNNGKVDMLFFQIINYINSSGNLVETELYNHECLRKYDGTIFTPEECEDDLFKIPVCPISKLYKTSFLKDNNIHFPIDLIFEDNVFFYNAFFHANKLGFIKKHFYYRRRHGNSITQVFNKKTFDIVEITNKILDIFIELNKYEILKKEVINHTFEMIMDWFLKSPLYLKNEFFSIIKSNYKGFNELKEDFRNNLNDEFKKIFKISLESEDYIDFITKFKLFNLEYDVIDSVKKNYKLSVIIPTYNTGNILHRTMNSIENQTIGFENIEVVIVDDCSNNETIEIINQYSKLDNVKVIYFNSNTGASGIPRNIGIKESSADYIMFLDHDDFFKHDALEELYGYIINNNCDLVFGTYSTITDGKLFDVYYPNEKNGYFKSILDNERLVAFPAPSIWTKLFKKSVVVENNILFPPILGEDAIFLFKFLLNSKGIYYLNNSLICYHDLNKKSTTNNVSFNYLMEGLSAEKYLLDIFDSIDKEYYFKYRLEGNLNFFLSQFFKSNLSENELNDILPLFYWFTEKGNYYNLTPREFKNKLLFNSLLQKDQFSIFELLKNDGCVGEDNNAYDNNDFEKFVIDIENKLDVLEETLEDSYLKIEMLKKELLHEKIENNELNYKMNSFKNLFLEYKELHDKNIFNKFLKIFK